MIFSSILEVHENQGFLVDNLLLKVLGIVGAKLTCINCASINSKSFKLSLLNSPVKLSFWVLNPIEKVDSEVTNHTSFAAKDNQTAIYNHSMKTHQIQTSFSK